MSLDTAKTIESLIQSAMSDLEMGCFFAARKTFVKCLGHVNELEQHNVIDNSCCSSSSTPDLPRVFDENTPLNKLELVALPLDCNGSRSPYQETVVDSMSQSVDKTRKQDQLHSNEFYFAAFKLLKNPEVYISEISTLTSVLLYNIAITYHKDVAFDGIRQSYSKALYTYKSILKLVRYKQNCSNSFAGMSQGLLRVATAACHNMGHIYKQLGEMILYRKLVCFGSQIERNIEDGMMPESERDFFAKSLYFALQSCRASAQAA